MDNELSQELIDFIDKPKLYSPVGGSNSLIVSDDDPNFVSHNSPLRCQCKADFIICYAKMTQEDLLCNHCRNHHKFNG